MSSNEGILIYSHPLVPGLIREFVYWRCLEPHPGIVDHTSLPISN